MGKLTNNQRDTIAKRAARSKYPQKRGYFLLEEQDKLAREVYDILVPKKVRDALASLPSGWLGKSRFVAFVYESGSRVAALNLDVGDNEENLLPSKGHYIPLGIIKGELAERVANLETRCADVKIKHDALRQSVNVMVSSVSTFAQLRKVWPEGAEFYADLDNEPAAYGLPAVQISEINAALGLPRETKEAA